MSTETGVIAAFRVVACAVEAARNAIQRDYVLSGPHALAAAPSDVTAGTEVHGGAPEAQEGSP